MPVVWNKEARKSIAKTALQNPTLLGMHLIGAVDDEDIVNLLASYALQGPAPKAGPEDLKRLIKRVPKEVIEQLLAEAPSSINMEDMKAGLAWGILVKATAEEFVDYLDEHLTNELEELSKWLSSKQRHLDIHSPMTEEDAEEIRSQIADATAKGDTSEAAWLGWDLESGASKDLTDLRREARRRIFEKAKPVIEDFAGPTGPAALSGIRP